MRLHTDFMPAAVGALKNAICALPYLAVMGMIWGYLLNAASGVIIGLLIAALAAAISGIATTIFSSRPAGGVAHRRYDPGRNTAGVRK